MKKQYIYHFCNADKQEIVANLYVNNHVGNGTLTSLIPGVKTIKIEAPIIYNDMEITFIWITYN